MVEARKRSVKRQPAKGTRGEGRVVPEGGPARAEDVADVTFDEPATPPRKPVVPVENSPPPAANEDAVDSIGLPNRTPPSSSDLN